MITNWFHFPFFFSSFLYFDNLKETIFFPFFILTGLPLIFTERIPFASRIVSFLEEGYLLLTVPVLVNG